MKINKTESISSRVVLPWTYDQYKRLKLVRKVWGFESFQLALQETRRIPADLPSDLGVEDSGEFCEVFSGGFLDRFTLPADFENPP
ncbi:hypothetical protein PIB30_101307, partial [Stylosanthes scabra]|nr:hypothetical protein [Stylosanthes scabra]